MIITLDTENKIITVDDPIYVSTLIEFADIHNIDLDEWRIGQSPLHFEAEIDDFLNSIEDEQDNGVIYHTTDTLGNC